VKGVQVDDGRLLTPGFLVIVFSGLGYFGAYGVIVPLLPRFAEKSLGAGSVTVGLVVGAFAISAVVTRPLVGKLGDRVGRRLPMRLGALVSGLAIACYGLAANVPALIGLRLVTGVGEALFFVSAITLVHDIAPVVRSGEAVSYFSVAVYLGLGLGPTLGEQLRHHVSYATGFAVAGAMAVFAAVVCLFIPYVPVPPRPHDAGKRPLVHRAAIGPGSVLALGLMGFTGFQTFVPLYVDRFQGVGSGGVFLLYSGVVLAVRIFGARLPDRIGPGPVATVALSLIAAGLAIVAAIATPWGLYGGTFVLGAGMALQYPALIALAVRRAPEHDRAAVLGTFTSFFDLASGFGGAFVGIAAAFGGYRSAFGAGAGLALAGLVLHRIQAAHDPSGRGPAGAQTRSEGGPGEGVAGAAVA